MLPEFKGPSSNDNGVIIIIDDVIEQIRLVSFDVTPSTIGLVEEAVVSWEVDGPTNQVQLSLNSTPIEPQGSVTIMPLLISNPLSSRTYRIYAKRGTVTKQLGRIELSIDDSECRQTGIAASNLANNVENQIVNQFNNMPNLVLNGPVSVLLDEDGIEIGISSEAKINNFFNADVDIDFKINVFTRLEDGVRRVAARVESVDVDVSWSWAEHFLSSLLLPGCLSILQAAMERLLEMCIENMMLSQIEEQIASQLQTIVDGALTLWQDTDSGNRRHFLISIYTTASSVEFIGCPEPNETRPPIFVDEFVDGFNTLTVDDD